MYLNQLSTILLIHLLLRQFSVLNQSKIIVWSILLIQLSWLDFFNRTM